MSTWPDTLPLPSIQGYEAAQQDKTFRTQMEVGQRVRRYSTSRTHQISVLWSFTDAQMAEFRDWYEDNEAAWFTITLATGDGGNITTEARFNEPWDATFIPGPHWNVSAMLEVET